MSDMLVVSCSHENVSVRVFMRPVHFFSEAIVHGHMWDAEYIASMDGKYRAYFDKIADVIEGSQIRRSETGWSIET